MSRQTTIVPRVSNDETTFAEKKWLVHQADVGFREAEGLLELLDALQDAAVDDLRLPEDRVFGPSEVE